MVGGSVHLHATDLRQQIGDARLAKSELDPFTTREPARPDRTKTLSNPCFRSTDEIIIQWLAADVQSGEDADQPVWKSDPCLVAIDSIYGDISRHHRAVVIEGDVCRYPVSECSHQFLDGERVRIGQRSGLVSDDTDGLGANRVRRRPRHRKHRLAVAQYLLDLVVVGLIGDCRLWKDEVQLHHS